MWHAMFFHGVLPTVPDCKVLEDRSTTNLRDGLILGWKSVEPAPGRPACAMASRCQQCHGHLSMHGDQAPHLSASPRGRHSGFCDSKHHILSPAGDGHGSEATTNTQRHSGLVSTNQPTFVSVCLPGGVQTSLLPLVRRVWPVASRPAR